MTEAKISESALFVTLTYNNDNIELTKNGFMTLNKRHVQLFFKKLRKNHEKRNKLELFNSMYQLPIKYYTVGEYGTKTQRPHYHAIIFNSSFEDVEKCWTHGDIYIGKLTPASAGYTLKYISKDKTIGKHSRDDREIEFSLMSKRLGVNYLTKNIKRWHKANLYERYYVPIEDGKKIAMPRYYKEKLYTKLERALIGKSLIDKKNKEFADKSYPQVLAEMNKQDKVRMRNAEKNRDNRNTKL